MATHDLAPERADPLVATSCRRAVSSAHSIAGVGIRSPSGRKRISYLSQDPRWGEISVSRIVGCEAAIWVDLYYCIILLYFSALGLHVPPTCGDRMIWL